MNKIEFNTNDRMTEIIIDGKRQNHVSSLDIHVVPLEPPSISITYNKGENSPKDKKSGRAAFELARLGAGLRGAGLLSTDAEANINYICNELLRRLP